MNNNIPFPNPQQTPVPIVSHPLNQSPRFPLMQQIPRMNSPQPNVLNLMTRLHEPQKFNQSKYSSSSFSPNSILLIASLNNALSYSQSPGSTTTTTTVDLSQNYSSQQINGINQNDYSSLQPRYPIQPSMNIPRQRQPSFNNTADAVQQFVTGNTNNSSNGDQCKSSNESKRSFQISILVLQRILLSNIDGGTNKIAIQNRQMTSPMMVNYYSYKT
jgi:hypothetical protein